MNLEDLREYCIVKPGVEETTPFGPDTLVFKVMGKAFLLTGFENSPIRFNVKCDPEKAIDLRERDDSVAVKLVKEWIDDSYQLVADSLPKKEKEKLEKNKSTKRK